MMHILQIFHLSTIQWIWIIVVAFLVGLSKLGISAATMPVIPIIAGVFGGKESTGIMLPMLLVGDVFALYYYKRHGNWGNIKKLLPWAVIGLIFGVIVGNYIDDKQFKILLFVSLFICLIILLYTEKKGDNLKVPKGKWFYALVGITAGFTSMIGNAAGPLFSIYLLAMGYKKNSYLGTNAWFFFIINFSKLPLQIFFWHNITIKTMALTCTMIPSIALGAIFGAIIIKKLNEKSFRYVIIGMTFVAAIKLII